MILYLSFIDGNVCYYQEFKEYQGYKFTFFQCSLSHDNSAHFGSVILASDLVRVVFWNVSNTKTGNLWFRDQFLVINEEKYMNGLKRFIS